LIVGLMIVPALTIGPERTAAYFEEWIDVLIMPAFGAGSDRSRAKELIEVTATDSQAPVAIIHNFLYPDRATRPPRPSLEVRLAHRLIGTALTLITVLAAGWRRPSDRIVEVFFLGALMLAMLLVSPVCHLHYFCLGMPVAMGL